MATFTFEEAAEPTSFSFEEAVRPQFGQPSSPLDPTLSEVERAAVSSPYEPGNIGAEQDFNLMTPLVEVPKVDAGADSPITRGIMQTLAPSLPPEATAAVINQLGGLASGMTSGAGMAAVGAGPGVGSIGRAVIGGSFAAPMIADIPESIREAKRLRTEGTPQEFFDAAGRVGANFVMPAAIGLGVKGDLAKRPLLQGGKTTGSQLAGRFSEEAVKLPEVTPAPEPVTAPKVEAKETIVSPAVKVGDKYFRGEGHPQAWEEATKRIDALKEAGKAEEAKVLEDAFDLRALDWEANHGFMVRGADGVQRYVPRPEMDAVYESITGKKPAKPGGLSSEETRAAGLTPKEHAEALATESKAAPGPQPDWRVSVQAPIGEFKGSVQLVDPRATEQSGAITLESLRKAGHEVPDFSKLPQGNYTYAEAVAKAKTASPETPAGGGGATPPKTPPAGSAPGGEPAPRGADLEAVYKIFEPSPKQRPSIGSVVKGAAESVRTGFSSKFRPLDKLTDDINSTYGSGAKRIAGTFEALKGSTGRSEAEVFRFDNDVSRAVKGNEKDFNAYMFLKRSLDRLNMDAADISKALAGGEVKNLNRRAVAGYTIPQLEANLAALESKIGPEVKSTFEKSADQYQQHMDKALRWQVESGRMSAEVYDSIKAGNQFYAPFKVLKYLEESNRPAGTGKRIDTPAEYTKAMEGIEDPNFKLGDMLAAGRMGLRVSRILSDKHAAMRTMADLAPFDVEGRFIQRLKEGAEAPAGSEAVNVFENGKQVRYAVPREVAEAVQLFDTQGTGLVETIFRGGAVPFRAGATAWNIPFQVSNLMADIPRSVLVARTGFRGNPVDIVRLPFDYVHSVYASIMGDVVSPLTGIKPPKLFLDFLDSGAAGTTMQEAFTPGALRFHQSSRLAQGTKLGKSVLRTIPQIATAIEQSTKIFGVKRAMRMSGQESGEALYKNGKDLLTEVRRFSGSPDFGRIGKWTDAYRLNVMVPFLNARIQGTVADLGRLSGRDGAKTAAATWTKLGLAIGVPTAALYALNNGDEYAEDYTKIPEKEKQNYWHIPKDSFVTLDSGEKIRDYWRIPKRESSKWVANLTESSLDFAKKQNPEQAGRWLKSLVEDISPVNIQGETAQERGESAVSGLNPLLKAPLEVVTGRDLYRHRDVVPQSMQKASPGNQFTDRTPEAFKRLAEAMPDITPEVLRSPIMLENMTRNLTAGLFTQFLPGRPVEGRTEFENNPLLKRFQAALYTDERELRQEIQSLQREAADTYLERNRAAEKILKDSKGAPLKDVLLSAAKSPGADLRLLQHTVDLYVAEKAGITGPERQLLALPVQQRAQFITRKLEDATPETKREIFLNFARKRILTEAVAEEIVKEMEPKK